jgi:acyl-CoA oxidase
LFTTCLLTCPKNRDLKLRVEDLQRYPNGSKKLFWAHRFAPTAFEGGLGIRLTVHYNLFSGTIANLGNQKHREFLTGVLERNEIGCFALTEQRAGVLSGLIVETVATFENEAFVIHTPNPDCAKRWISNGLVAEWAVVIAKLIIHAKDYGPHAFIVDMRSKGIKRTNMDAKVAFNGLDNALIEFDNVRVERSFLLGATVERDGTYVVDPSLGGKDGQPVGFIQVAQRLLSGRIALAGSALGMIRHVCRETENYAESRRIPVGPDMSIPLATLPVFSDTVARIKRRHCVLTRFPERIESMYVQDKDLSPKLVELIAVAKVSCCDFALDSYHELKRAVGSFSVLEDSPFGSRLNAEALLYCVRFAEGDSAVLCQKIARDAIKQYQRKWWLLLSDSLRLPVLALVDWTSASLLYYKLRLAMGMLFYGSIKGGGGDLKAKRQIFTWLHSHALVNRIAKLTCDIAIRDLSQESAQ